MTTDIAVVGLGCRFPGGVRDLDSYGGLLRSGEHQFTDVPAERWDRGYCDPGGAPGTTRNHVGAFLDEIDRFDCSFFGVLPREAPFLDPQQRLFLEVAWEAMSDSGRPRAAWRGSRTAVYAGMLANDYNLLHTRMRGVAGVGPQYVTGLDFSFAAGRLAYAFDLRGPVSAVGSACSSSLLAVHQACQSLRAADCDTAVAGGVSLLIAPDISVFLSSVGAISPSGRCRPFDAAADGIVRGEGCGVVVLKRLDDALADRDRIYGIIRGSAANNDGASLGLTVPSAEAQSALLRGALDRAGVSATQVDYVEAHGTGTAIGDLIELEALASVYGAGRAREDRPLLVGSHKALLGHMDAAAGIGGLLKALWVVGSGRVPAQPFVETPNPAIDWDRDGLRVPGELVGVGDAAAEIGRPTRAGVSSFGLSGTNVHVIVEAWAGAADEPQQDSGGPLVLLASSTHAEGLKQQVAALRAQVAEELVPLDDLLASAATRRTHEAHRIGVVATDRDELLRALDEAAGSDASVVVDADSVPPPVFVFGAEADAVLARTVADLYETDGAVRDVIDACDEVVRAEAQWSLVEELRAEQSVPAQTGSAQADPARADVVCVAAQLALSRWLTARTVVPTVAIGHGLGWIAAAHVSGTLSIADAVRAALSPTTAVADDSPWARLEGLLEPDASAVVALCLKRPQLTELTDLLRDREPKPPLITVPEDDDRDGVRGLHRALVRLHLAGVPVDWESVTGTPGCYQTLPVPSWGGDRYWLPGVARGQQTLETAVTGHQPEVVPATADTADRVSAPVRTSATANRSSGARLVAHVEAAVRAVLGLTSGQPLARRRGLFEQGLESLAAVALRKRLAADFDLELPSSLVFEHPTIAALAEHLAQCGAVTAGADGPSAPSTGPTPVGTPRAVPAPRPDSAVRENDDGIAVIGMACRLPGAASPDEFWELLTSGREAVGEPPAGRRDDPLWEKIAADIPSAGYYLDDVAGFDAPFFRISPREARLLDPQQRLFLEVAWEALEAAGCPAHTLDGRPVGVYAGLATADYQNLLADDLAADATGDRCQSPDGCGASLYHGTGSSYAAIAGRLSYVLGLTGPSMTIDTACSASLTAVHLACQALRSGDCEVALVGGASLILAPSPLMASMASGGALAKDGRCKAFDEAADGFGCGEGAVVLVLKPLRAARRDGDRVHAVLRASAVNQDGASGGLTVPSARAQADVVRRAAERAGWAPHEIDYVETHGTGTPLGDPIEISALAQALGGGRRADEPLLIGSAKANVGHLGAAAGAVGLLKVVMAVRDRELPPHLVRQPSTRVDWERLPIALVQEHRGWPERGRPARAGVSAFGFSGSNAHVLVEEPPREDAAAADENWDQPPYVVAFSAASESALRSVAGRIGDALSADPEALGRVSSTLLYRRSWLEHRAVLTGRNLEEIVSGLDDLTVGRMPANGHVGRVDPGEERALVFRYGGSPPSSATRRELCAAAGTYARALAEHAAQLAEILGEPVGLYADPTDSLRAAYAFCHQAALTRLWAGLGVMPQDASVADENDRAAQAGARWARGELSAEAALRAIVDSDPILAADEPEQGESERSGTELDDADDDVVIDLAAVDDAASALGIPARLIATGYRPVQPVGAVVRPVPLPSYPWEHQRYWYREFEAGEPVSWALSGRSAADLRDRARAVRELAAGRGRRPADLAAVAHELTRLPALRERLVVTGTSRRELLAGLDAFGAGEQPGEGIAQGSAISAPRVAFVFAGQGWQRPGMGARLLDACPAFADAVGEVDELVRDLAGWSVLDVLRQADGAPEFSRVDIVQPTMFAVSVGLARTWQAAGVNPSAVVGHSQGEIAAAHIAGALDLADAVRVVVGRARALTSLSGTGGMGSIAAAPDVVESAIGRLKPAGRVWVAAANGPSSTVVTGEPSALKTLIAGFDDKGVRARLIDVDYASHCPLVEPVGEQLLKELADVRPRAGSVPVYSTLTGVITDGADLDAQYWWNNLRQPVRFQHAVEALLGDGHRVLIESSAHPVLTIGIEQTAQAASADGNADESGQQPVILGTLRRDRDEVRALHDAFARAWCGGLAVDWTVTGGNSAAVVNESPNSDLAQALSGSGDVNADRCYQVEWRPMAAQETSRAPEAALLRGTWIVVRPDASAPGSGAGSSPIDQCADALAEHGAVVSALTIDPRRTDPADLESALASVAEPAGVLNLLPLGEEAQLEDPAASAGLLGTLELLRALERVHPSAPVWTATCAAMAVAEAVPAVRPEQAAVWGMIRVAGLEQPGHPLALIDLPGTLDDDDRLRLAAALAQRAEDQIALRGGELNARRLVRASRSVTNAGTGTNAAAPQRSWQPRGTTLITGGTGALGAHTARYLAGRNADHLLLLSRRGMQAPGAQELAAELTALGTRVTIVACDVADARRLGEVLDAIPAEHPLTAVIHTAGIPGSEDRVSELTAQRLAEVMAPKIAGAVNLHELTKGHDLSAFVLYSSLGSLLPNVGQGGYAAANAYLVALAEQRRAAGLPATAIAWGTWAGGGMAHGDGFLAWLERTGVTLMPPQEATAALGAALDHDETATVIADIEWTRFAEVFNATRRHPLIAELVQAAQDGSDDAARHPLAAQLAGLPEGEREAALIEAVRGHVAAVMGHGGARSIDPARPFRDLGFDSVTGVELRNRLVAATGLRVPHTAIFDYPTPARLARFVLDELAPEPAAQEQHGAGAVQDEAAVEVGSDAIDEMDADALTRLVLGEA